MFRIASICALAMAFAIAGCGHRITPAHAKHMVCADSTGQPCDGTDGYAPMDQNQHAAHVRAIIAEVKKAAHAKAGGSLPVMIFVHGGLNTAGGVLERTAALTDRLMDKEQGIYPIFINWPCGLGSSYGEHLLRVRQGRVWRRFAGWITSPFVLVSDVGRAVTRAPLSFAETAQTFWYSFRSVSRTYQRLHDAPGGTSAPGGAGTGFILWSDERERSGRRNWRTVSGFLLMPVHLVTGVIVDAGGTQAWTNMLRRAKSLFHATSEFTDGADHAHRADGDGALAVFLSEWSEDAELRRLIAQGTVRVTLVGHSMGTIVANEMLKAHPEIRYESIVYMAAACSTKDVIEAVFPYLRRHSRLGLPEWFLRLRRALGARTWLEGLVASTSETLPDPRFYSLMLHPANEVNESHVIADFPLVPRGSLLVWIDQMFSNPEHFLNRTFGRFSNIVEAVHVIPADLRPNILLHAFPRRGHLVPIEHGDFCVDKPFWSEAWWRGEGASGTQVKSITLRAAQSALQQSP